jgi:hypothetical protein
LPIISRKGGKEKPDKAGSGRDYCWLTGDNKEGLQKQLDKEVDFSTFFNEAPQMNPNCGLIKRVVCGCRVEEIEDPLMQKNQILG